MSRELKFRFWGKFGELNEEKDECENEMLYGDRFCFQHAEPIDTLFADKSFVVMQFTGLIDKNGKEVYEGDIIKWKETRFWNKQQEQKGVAMPRFFKSEVVYDDAGFLVSSTQEFDTPLCCFFIKEDVHNQFDYKAEVIGNIYENPELLK